DRQPELVVVKPGPVVKHETNEALLGTLRRIASAAHSAAMLAAQITGQRKRHFVHKFSRAVVILDLHAVVRVIAYASWCIKRIFTQGILVPENRKPSIRPPQNLHP